MLKKIKRCKTLRYKMIFCDIDDTLLDDNLKISSEDIAAISQYTQMGGLFVLATGRNYIAVEDIYKKLNINTPIIINLGTVYNPNENKVLYTQVLPQQPLVELCRYLEDLEIYFQLFCDNRIFVKKYTQYTQQYIERCGVSIDTTNIDLSSFILKQCLSFQKLMIECDENIVDNLVNKLKIKFGGIFSITKSKKWIIEVCPKDAAKGNAVDYITEYFNVSKEKTMSIGDSHNDLLMFEKTGFSVAMFNSFAEIKERADYITSSNNQSGVSKAINLLAYLSSGENDKN